MPERDALVDDAFSEREPSSRGRPASFKLPQIVVEGMVRRSLKSDVITFQVRVLRLLELTFLIPIPAMGAAKVPVYIRFYIDSSQQDPPGTVRIK